MPDPPRCRERPRSLDAHGEERASLDEVVFDRREKVNLIPPLSSTFHCRSIPTDAAVDIMPSSLVFQIQLVLVSSTSMSLSLENPRLTKAFTNALARLCPSPESVFVMAHGARALQVGLVNVFRYLRLQHAGEAPWRGCCGSNRE